MRRPAKAEDGLRPMAMTRRRFPWPRRPVDDEQTRPRSPGTALAAQLSAPLRHFLATESGSAGILLAAALVALLWANSPWSHAYEALWSTVVSFQVGDASLSMDLHHWVNDGVMALFFFVIGLEVRRELSVGELTDRRRARLPVLAGVAGMVVPALLFLLISPAGEARNGWGIVIGTDTAFMLGALAVVGPRLATQLRVFLLTLTVIDDIVAVTVIGVVYSGALDVAWLAAALACLVLLASANRLGVWRAAPYVVISLMLWLATLESGLHSSIAGMLAGLLIAARTPRKDAVEGAVARFRAFRQSPTVDLSRSTTKSVIRTISVNDRLQAALHPWTSYLVVPLFALANAGVDLRGGLLADALRSPLTWAIVVGLVLGKPIGIAGSTLLGARLGVGRLPQGVGAGHIAGGAALSGIGFTVSLLIIGLAFPDGAMADQATVGVLLSALLAMGLGWLLFAAGRLFLGEGDADLPRTLDRPVDPDVDHIRGPVDAPLTLVEYGDFECPFCARATSLMQDLRLGFGEELRYVFRHLPLTDVHPHAEMAARAALAADRQGRFWTMHDKLFGHQDQMEAADLVGYAADLGLDVEQFLRDLEDPQLAERIREDVASAEASGARATPTFFVNGIRHVGPYDALSLAEELRATRPGVARGARS